MVVRYEVSTTVIMKITVFWDVLPCSLIDVSEERAAAFFEVDDGSNSFLRCVGKHVSYFTASRTRRQYSSHFMGVIGFHISSPSDGFTVTD
jgi:hypothetical protein